MGESSAKHLRGESMEDVIFNGSSSAQAGRQRRSSSCSTTTTARSAANYANYAEVSLKRLARDGTSTYFINGALPAQGRHASVPRHRPRIAQLLDHRAGHDLAPHRGARRGHALLLEEAAGISRYKDRRRETELRIGHTRENLERLDRPARGSRQADPAPAAPGRHRAPLPGEHGSQAPAAGRVAGAQDP